MRTTTIREDDRCLDCEVRAQTLQNSFNDGLCTTCRNAYTRRDARRADAHLRCPDCGNTNPDHIEDNGLGYSNPELTLLCTAPVPARGHWNADLRPEDIDAKGMTACGHQWNPNYEE